MKFYFPLPLAADAVTFDVSPEWCYNAHAIMTRDEPTQYRELNLWSQLLSRSRYIGKSTQDILEKARGRLNVFIYIWNINYSIKCMQLHRILDATSHVLWTGHEDISLYLTFIQSLGFLFLERPVINCLSDACGYTGWPHSIDSRHFRSSPF